MKHFYPSHNSHLHNFAHFRLKKEKKREKLNSTLPREPKALNAASMNRQGKKVGMSWSENWINNSETSNEKWKMSATIHRNASTELVSLAGGEFAEMFSHFSPRLILDFFFHRHDDDLASITSRYFQKNSTT